MCPCVRRLIHKVSLPSLVLSCLLSLAQRVALRFPEHALVARLANLDPVVEVSTPEGVPACPESFLQVFIGRLVFVNQVMMVPCQGEYEQGKL